MTNSNPSRKFSIWIRFFGLRWWRWFCIVTIIHQDIFCLRPTTARYLLNMSRMYNPFLPMDNFLMENLPVLAYFSTMVSSRAIVSMYRSPPILISFSTFTENIVANIEWRRDWSINYTFKASNYIGIVVDMFPTPNWCKLQFQGKKGWKYIATNIHEVDKREFSQTVTGTYFIWKKKQYSFLYAAKAILLGIK